MTLGVMEASVRRMETHRVAFKKLGMKVSVKLTANRKMLFSKGHRGRSCTMMNNYGDLMNHDFEDVVRSIRGQSPESGLPREICNSTDTPRRWGSCSPQG